MRKINNGRYLQTYRRYQSTKIENLDSRVNEALSSNNDDALFILSETLYNFGLTPQGLEVLERCIINTQMKVNYSFTLSKVSCLKTKLTKHLNI